MIEKVIEEAEDQLEVFKRSVKAIKSIKILDEGEDAKRGKYLSKMEGCMNGMFMLVCGLNRSSAMTLTPPMAPPIQTLPTEPMKQAPTTLATDVGPSEPVSKGRLVPQKTKWFFVRKVEKMIGLGHVKDCIVTVGMKKLRKGKAEVTSMVKGIQRRKWKNPKTGDFVETQTVNVGLDSILYNVIIEQGFLMINKKKYRELESCRAPYGFEEEETDSGEEEEED